jgi:hypothetical protein
MARGATALDLSYVASDLPDRAAYLTSVAAWLHHAIAGEVVGWNAVDAAQPIVEGWMDPPQSDDWDRLVAGTVHLNPMIGTYLKAPADQAPRRMSDCVSDRELRSSRFYHELFVPLEAKYQISIVVGRFTSSAGNAWAINRAGCDFTDRDVETATMLQLLDRAYQPQLEQLSDLTHDAAQRS